MHLIRTEEEQCRYFDALTERYNRLTYGNRPKPGAGTSEFLKIAGLLWLLVAVPIFLFGVALAILFP